MDDEQTRVMVAELRGELGTAMAEITGDLKVLRARNEAIEGKLDELTQSIKDLTRASSSYVTKEDVARRVNISTAIASVIIAALAFFVTQIPTLTA